MGENRSFGAFCLKFYIFVLAMHQGSTLSNPSDEARLVKKIFDNYTNAVRPAESSVDALRVDFSVRVIQVIDFDEKNQVLTWNLWIRQSWKDYRLTWNKSEYRLSRLVLNPLWVWVPDIYLYNNAQEQYRGFDYDTQDGIVVTSDGNAVWYIQSIMKSTCKFAVKYFPFDEQKCELEFGSWTHSGAQLNLSLYKDNGDIDEATGNGEWVLADFTAVRNVAYYNCCPEPYPSLTFTLTARRRANFYLSNFMLPCVLIALISVLAFCLPYKSGERVNFLITSLLSLTIFFLMISDMIPSTPDGTPLFSQFMIAILIEISIALTVICIVINVESNLSQPSKFVYLLLNKYLSSLVCLRPIDGVLNDTNLKRDILDSVNEHEDGGETFFDSNSQGVEKLANEHQDTLSVNETPDNSSSEKDTFSNQFNDNMLQVLEEMACNSVEKLRSVEIAKERFVLATRMDRVLHVFFSIVVLATVVVVLCIPPELNL